jgi:hypothetical protein
MTVKVIHVAGWSIHAQRSRNGHNRLRVGQGDETIPEHLQYWFDYEDYNVFECYGQIHVFPII